MAKKKSKTPLIAGGIAGGCLLLCICGGVITLLIVGASDSTTSSGGGGETATAISAMNLLMEGGTDEWDQSVKALMVDGYDSDGSGEIDTAAEVGLVDCATWKALDAGVKEKWDYGIRTIYGFHADYSWIGYAVGFAESQRPAADTSLAACIGEDASFEGQAAPATGGTATAGGGDVGTQIKALPNGGSSEWDGKVKVIMLANYDADGSGWINTPAEVSGVSCDAWKAMDEGVKSMYGFGIRSIYGFEEGYSWVGSAVGFDEAMRAKADKALVGCVGS